MVKHYGLIGYPLSHSFSKKYFTEKFEKDNITDCEYHLYPIENISKLPQLIAENTQLCGLNVTIPYKESVIPFLDELDETAKAVGAVNCIKIVNPSSSHILKGYNTDIFGFRQSIKPFLEIQHERALILGTGGASKAVAFVLKEIGIDCYFVTRDKQKATVPPLYADKLFTYEELNEYIINAFKLIINTSPVGMYPNANEAPPIPYQFLQFSHLLYDLVYNPIETEFLKQGKLKGTAVVNGLSMLHLQAEEAWRIWNV
jgi:shikimate dehydrogenase